MLDLLRQFFLNPSMLWGSLLVGVPIIIYLINRQRFRRRRWAAMEFLLRALRRNRRRLQLQNWLLLLVRCLLVLLLSLAASRPVSRLGVLRLKPDESQNWVLCVDLSYSMGYQEGGRSLFDQARETIARMSETLLKPGDQVVLTTFEASPKMVLPPTVLAGEGRGGLLEAVDHLELTNRAVDLGASLAVLDEAASQLVTPLGEPMPKRIILFSDLQSKDWIQGDAPKDPGIAQYLEKIRKEGGELAQAQLLARASPGNLAVTELTVHPTLIARNLWVELQATVRNFGVEDFRNVDLSIRVDQDPSTPGTEPQIGDVVDVPAGGSVTRVLPFRFEEAGYHTVTAELRSDGLVIDNRRHLALKVEEDLRILLVDGDPAADVVSRETFHLEVAFSPDDDLGGLQGRFTPFDPQHITPDQLPQVELAEYSAVFLANVGEFSQPVADKIKSYVRGGGALVVFLGANVRPDAYEEAFGGEGERLLPVQLERIRGDERSPVHLELSDLQHPLSRYFEEHKDVTHLHRPVISFYKYFQVSPLAAQSGGVRVAMTYTDLDHSPAVFDNAYGSGRALWITTTADGEWNDLSSWPDFVVLLYEAVSYLVGEGRASSNILVGEPFKRTYAASAFAPEVFLTLPLNPLNPLDTTVTKPGTVRKVMRELPGGLEFLISHDETDVPGLYALDFRRAATAPGDSRESFAVALDVEESDLRSMTGEDFATAFPDMRLQVFDASARIREVEGATQLERGTELWKPLVAGVLVLLLVESLLAWIFGRRVR